MFFILLFLLQGPEIAIEGFIEDSLSGRPIAGAEIVLLPAGTLAKTSQKGAFHVQLVPGSYVLEISAKGYVTDQIELEVTGPIVPLHLPLQAEKRLIETMTVMPSQYSLMEKDPASPSALSKREINQMPKFGDDIYRLVAQMPGTNAKGFLAQFTVRGGLENETQVLLDGLEIQEPFHLKDFGSVFSAVDPEVIGRLDLFTGGYTAPYGEKMSGILDFHSSAPREKRTSIGMSFSNAHFATEGTFAGGLGHYLFSLRRGYLDILLSLSGANEDEGEKMEIPYYDSFGKLQYSLSDQHTIALEYLLSDDKLVFVDRGDDEPGEIGTAYGSKYLWASLHSFWSAQLESQSIVFYTVFDRDRDAHGENFYNTTQSVVDEKIDSDAYGIKQNWQWAISSRSQLRFGFEYKQQQADYHYYSRYESALPVFGPQFRERTHHFDTQGSSQQAYLSHRIQLGERWVAEWGARFDDYEYLDDSLLSPRFNLAYQVSPETTLRLALGRFGQGQAINELQVSDDVTEFDQIAYSDHYLLSLEHHLDSGLQIKAEAYYKDIQNLSTRYETIFAFLDPFPEWRDDRFALEVTQAEAYGFDLVLNQQMNSRLNWYLNYSYAVAEDQIAGEKVPRRWGGPHFAKASLNWEKNRKWNFHLNWTYTPGRRTQDLFFAQVQNPDGSFSVEPQIGPLYQKSYPAYHALNFRLTRNLIKPNQRGFSFFLDVTNFYNREVQLGFDYEIFRIPNGYAIEQYSDDSLPILPSLGFSYVF